MDKSFYVALLLRYIIDDCEKETSSDLLDIIDKRHSILLLDKNVSIKKSVKAFFEDSRNVFNTFNMYNAIDLHPILLQNYFDGESLPQPPKFYGCTLDLINCITLSDIYSEFADNIIRNCPEQFILTYQSLILRLEVELRNKFKINKIHQHFTVLWADIIVRISFIKIFEFDIYQFQFFKTTTKKEEFQHRQMIELMKLHYETNIGADINMRFAHKSIDWISIDDDDVFNAKMSRRKLASVDYDYDLTDGRLACKTYTQLPFETQIVSSFDNLVGDQNEWIQRKDQYVYVSAIKYFLDTMSTFYDKYTDLNLLYNASYTKTLSLVSKDDANPDDIDSDYLCKLEHIIMNFIYYFDSNILNLILDFTLKLDSISRYYEGQHLQEVTDQIKWNAYLDFNVNHFLYIPGVYNDDEIISLLFSTFPEKIKYRHLAAFLKTRSNSDAVTKLKTKIKTQGADEDAELKLLQDCIETNTYDLSKFEATTVSEEKKFKFEIDLKQLKRYALLDQTPAAFNRNPYNPYDNHWHYQTLSYKVSNITDYDSSDLMRLVLQRNIECIALQKKINEKKILVDWQVFQILKEFEIEQHPTEDIISITDCLRDPKCYRYMCRHLFAKRWNRLVTSSKKNTACLKIDVLDDLYINPRIGVEKLPWEYRKKIIILTRYLFDNKDIKIEKKENSSAFLKNYYQKLFAAKSDKNSFETFIRSMVFKTFAIFKPDQLIARINGFELCFNNIIDQHFNLFGYNNHIIPPVFKSYVNNKSRQRYNKNENCYDITVEFKIEERTLTLLDVDFFDRNKDRLIENSLYIFPEIHHYPETDDMQIFFHRRCIFGLFFNNSTEPYIGILQNVAECNWYNIVYTPISADYKPFIFKQYGLEPYIEEPRSAFFEGNNIYKHFFEMKINNITVAIIVEENNFSNVKTTILWVNPESQQENIDHIKSDCHLYQGFFKNIWNSLKPDGCCSVKELTFCKQLSIQIPFYLGLILLDNNYMVISLKAIEEIIMQMDYNICIVKVLTVLYEILRHEQYVNNGSIIDPNPNPCLPDALGRYGSYFQFRAYMNQLLPKNKTTTTNYDELVMNLTSQLRNNIDPNFSKLYFYTFVMYFYCTSYMRSILSKKYSNIFSFYNLTDDLATLTSNFVGGDDHDDSMMRDQFIVQDYISFLFNNINIGHPYFQQIISKYRECVRLTYSYNNSVLLSHSSSTAILTKQELTETNVYPFSYVMFKKYDHHFIRDLIQAAFVDNSIMTLKPQITATENCNVPIRVNNLSLIFQKDDVSISTTPIIGSIHEEFEVLFSSEPILVGKFEKIDSFNFKHLNEELYFEKTENSLIITFKKIPLIKYDGAVWIHMTDSEIAFIIQYSYKDAMGQARTIRYGNDTIPHYALFAFVSEEEDVPEDEDEDEEVEAIQYNIYRRPRIFQYDGNLIQTNFDDYEEDDNFPDIEFINFAKANNNEKNIPLLMEKLVITIQTPPFNPEPNLPFPFNKPVDLSQYYNQKKVKTYVETNDTIQLINNEYAADNLLIIQKLFFALNAYLPMFLQNVTNTNIFRVFLLQKGWDRNELFELIPKKEMPVEDDPSQTISGKVSSFFSQSGGGKKSSYVQVSKKELKVILKLCRPDEILQSNNDDDDMEPFDGTKSKKYFFIHHTVLNELGKRIEKSTYILHYNTTEIRHHADKLYSEFKSTGLAKLFRRKYVVPIAEYSNSLTNLDHHISSTLKHLIRNCNAYIDDMQLYQSKIKLIGEEVMILLKNAKLLLEIEEIYYAVVVGFTKLNKEKLIELSDVHIQLQEEIIDFYKHEYQSFLESPLLVEKIEENKAFIKYYRDAKQKMKSFSKSQMEQISELLNHRENLFLALFISYEIFSTK